MVANLPEPLGLVCAYHYSENAKKRDYDTSQKKNSNHQPSPHGVEKADPNAMASALQHHRLEPFRRQSLDRFQTCLYDEIDLDEAKRCF